MRPACSAGTAFSVATVARRTEADGDDSSGRAHSETPTLRGMLDVLVYAPLGFALSAGTLVPELAAKGRARAQEQLRLARMIGQLAVPVVRRKGERLVREQVDRATRSATRIKPANTAPQETAVAPKVVRHSPQQMPKRASTRTTPTTGPGESARSCVTSGVRAGWPGCRRLCRSVTSASSRSALYDVADHSSTPMP